MNDSSIVSIVLGWIIGMVMILGFAFWELVADGFGNAYPFLVSAMAGLVAGLAFIVIVRRKRKK